MATDLPARLAALRAAAELLGLPVTVAYSRRPPPMPGATGEVDATIRDNDDEPLAALLPMDVDADATATAVDPRAEAMAVILNDALPLLDALLAEVRRLTDESAGYRKQFAEANENDEDAHECERCGELYDDEDCHATDTGFVCMGCFLRGEPVDPAALAPPRTPRSRR